MEYYAGLDVSMEETHLCVLDRDGNVIREGKTWSIPAAIEAFLATGPACRQVVFETLASCVEKHLVSLLKGRFDINGDMSTLCTLLPFSALIFTEFGLLTTYSLPSPGIWL